MKKSIIICIASFTMMIIFTGCKKDDLVVPQPPACQTQPASYIKTINFFDFNPSGPYWNKVVANFKLAQATNFCPSLSSSTTMIIKNNTGATVTLDYNINFSLNFVHWNYQGVVTLPPFGTIDEGAISGNAARLDLGTVIIQAANISYN